MGKVQEKSPAPSGADALRGTRARSAEESFKQSLPANQRETRAVLRGEYRKTQPKVTSEVIPSSVPDGLQTLTRLPDSCTRITTNGLSPATGTNLNGETPDLTRVDIRPPNARITVSPNGVSAGAVTNIGDVQVQGRINANPGRDVGQPVSGSGSVLVPTGNRSAVVVTGRSTIVSNDDKMNSGARAEFVYNPAGKVQQEPFGGPDGVYVGVSYDTQQFGKKKTGTLGINAGTAGVNVGGATLDAYVGADIDPKGSATPTGGAMVTIGEVSTTEPSALWQIGLDATPEEVTGYVGVDFRF